MGDSVLADDAPPADIRVREAAAREPCDLSLLSGEGTRRRVRWSRSIASR